MVHPAPTGGGQRVSQLGNAQHATDSGTRGCRVGRREPQAMRGLGSWKAAGYQRQDGQPHGPGQISGSASSEGVDREQDKGADGALGMSC